MRIVLFCHPAFMRSQSMPRFANMLAARYAARGIDVRRWAPRPYFRKLARGEFLGKWAGYLDQYLLFPLSVRKRVKREPADTLFVFCDQAMGPWLPLVAHRPHVVHAHDLLALRSALGEIPENPTSTTGRIYQRFIRHGVRRGRYFISISNKTREDLQRYTGVRPVLSEVVYNGLNYPYSRLPSAQAQQILAGAGLPVEERGMLLHVGGGQWYKNFRGVLALYARYAAHHARPLPLWCVSPQPKGRVQELLREIPSTGAVHFVQNIDSRTLQAAYSHARALLFPSLEEGFGWPLIEAVACGCPVLTTDHAPMNEIAGPRAAYVPRLRMTDDSSAWASGAASILEGLLSRPDAERTADLEHSVQWIRRFDSDRTIDRYLEIYRAVLDAETAQQAADIRSNTEIPS
jgi:glycosyltransferase involved in cell wall biosynthesis